MSSSQQGFAAAAPTLGVCPGLSRGNEMRSRLLPQAKMTWHRKPWPQEPTRPAITENGTRAACLGASHAMKCSDAGGELRTQRMRIMHHLSLKARMQLRQCMCAWATCIVTQSDRGAPDLAQEEVLEGGEDTAQAPCGVPKGVSRGHVGQQLPPSVERGACMHEQTCKSACGNTMRARCRLQNGYDKSAGQGAGEWQRPRPIYTRHLRLQQRSTNSQLREVRSTRAIT